MPKGSDKDVLKYFRYINW